MTEFDRHTLSAYLDGELDRSTMREIEIFLDHNVDARRHMIEALHATVMLQAAGRAALEEQVPSRLESAIKSPVRTGPLRHLSWRSSLRPALAFALLIFGVGLGLFLRPPVPGPAPQSFPALPAAYLQAVNESLENHRSGDPLVLETEGPRQRIVVTPTRTYRNRRGQYFRDYHLDIFHGNTHRQLNGLAMRTGKHQWATTAIFYPREASRL